MFRGYFKEFKCHNIWLTGKKCPYKKTVKFWFETSKNYHCRCRTWGCKCLCPQVNATFSQKVKTALSFPELSFCFPELSFCLSEVFIYLMFLSFKNGFCHRWLYVLLFLLKAAQRDLLGWIWIVNFLKDILFLRMQVNFFLQLSDTERQCCYIILCFLQFINVRKFIYDGQNAGHVASLKCRFIDSQFIQNLLVDRKFDLLFKNPK